MQAGNGVAHGRIGPDTRLRVTDTVLTGMHEPGESHFELLRAFADDPVLLQRPPDRNGAALPHPRVRRLPADRATQRRVILDSPLINSNPRGRVTHRYHQSVVCAAVILLASLMFIPIVLIPIWPLTTGILFLRRPVTA